MTHLLSWTHSTFLVLAEPAGPWGIIPTVSDYRKLAAFALAVVMILLLKTRRQPIPPAAWIVISLLVLTPIGASVYQWGSKAREDSNAIYRVRVTVVDLQNTPVESATVTSSIGGEEHTVKGGAQFIIPAATVPQNGKVTIYRRSMMASIICDYWLTRCE